MADAAFTYTGLNTLGYPAYRDTDSQKMLIAEPGSTYRMQAVDGGPVPPGDGRWETAKPSRPGPSAAPKGGE